MMFHRRGVELVFGVAHRRAHGHACLDRVFTTSKENQNFKSRLHAVPFFGSFPTEASSRV